jgi:hypothetical protein
MSFTMTLSSPDTETAKTAGPAAGRPAFSFVVPCSQDRRTGCGAARLQFRGALLQRGAEPGRNGGGDREVNPRNLGLGGAYKAGVAAASGIHVMMVPGDNAHPAHGITPIIAAVDSADMVIPYVTNPEVRSFMRRLASRGFVVIMNALFGLEVPYYNGLVVHRLDLLREIEIETDSFAYQAEAVVKLLKRGAKFQTVGVEINTREHGNTKAFRVSNVINVFRALLDLKRRVG